MVQSQSVMIKWYGEESSASVSWKVHHPSAFMAAEQEQVSHSPFVYKGTDDVSSFTSHGKVRSSHPPLTSQHHQVEVRRFGSCETFRAIPTSLLPATTRVPLCKTVLIKYKQQQQQQQQKTKKTIFIHWQKCIIEKPDYFPPTNDHSNYWQHS